MKTILLEILVPTRSKNEIIPVEYHRLWDDKINKLTGGLTILKSVIGNWIDNDHKFVDRMIPVRIACNHSQVDKIIQITMEHYSEEKVIMAYIISTEVIFRERSHG